MQIKKIAQTPGLVATVVDNLTNSSTIDALSANQGRVLNEKITKLTTYSTEEVKTGETWIDGKPIYKKTIQFTTSAIGKHSIKHNRSEEHTSELQSRFDLVCRLLLEKKKKKKKKNTT